MGVLREWRSASDLLLSQCAGIGALEARILNRAESRGARAVPFCPETSDLRQGIGNEEHAIGKQANLTLGAEVPIGEILGTNVQFVGNSASSYLSIMGCSV
jgi:hypothetical protein